MNSFSLSHVNRTFPQQESLFLHSNRIENAERLGRLFLAYLSLVSAAKSAPSAPSSDLAKLGHSGTGVGQLTVTMASPKLPQVV
jgi:hypothetical protein